MEFLKLDGKTAIVTGGAGLIGQVYTSTLLKNGANVILLDKKINEKNILNKLKKEYKINHKFMKNLKLIECDITSKSSVDKTFKKLGKINNLKILVNNASLVKQVGKESLIDEYKSFLDMNPNDWENYFSVDLTGTLLISQKCIPQMKKNKGGSIVNISSTYGILSPDQRLYETFNKKLNTSQKKKGIVIEKPIGYSISKSGILNLTRFLATKFAKDDIRVNTLTLGGVFDNNPPSFVKAYSERTPLGRMANKNEYAGPLLFLVSDMSSYMTGANLIVDGGWSSW